MALAGLFAFLVTVPSWAVDPPPNEGPHVRGGILFEARCARCHGGVESFDGKHFGRPGWEATMLRMRWLNGAEVTGPERAAISAYLMTRNPPSQFRGLMEWGVLLGLCAAMILFVAALIRRRGKR